MIILKTIAAGLLFLMLGACAAKPFQPPPPMFLMYERGGASITDVKDAMLSCGFPNYITGRNSGDLIGDTARRERCMFLKGFRYVDGYLGICSTKAGKSMAECQGDK